MLHTPRPSKQATQASLATESLLSRTCADMAVAREQASRTSCVWLAESTAAHRQRVQSAWVAGRGQQVVPQQVFLLLPNRDQEVDCCLGGLRGRKLVQDVTQGFQVFLQTATALASEAVKQLQVLHCLTSSSSSICCRQACQAGRS